jgi:DNA-binding transcriptional regulator YiaG
MSSSKKHKQPCHCCKGSGEEFNVKDGARIRSLRLHYELSLRELARRMKISHSYLHQLEMGRRNWNLQLIDQAEKGINL